MSREVSSDEFVFESAALYRRDGFDNGGILHHAFPHLSASEARTLLVDVLYQHVLSRLDQTVQGVTVPTKCNPLRAVAVNGTSVHWPTPEVGVGPPLSPARVVVSRDAVLECMKRLRLPSPPREEAA
jgi:hypothetical protein